MTHPTPAEPTPIDAEPRRSRLVRWKDAEPVRLYVYGILTAVLLVLVVVGAITEDLSAALTGVAAAVLVAVPSALAVRPSVWSPQGHVQDLVRSRGSWAVLDPSGIGGPQ